jgi:general stress protein 26
MIHMALSKKEIYQYLSENKSVVLATVGKDGQPDLRSLGGYNFDGFHLYFGTASNSKKVEQIKDNSKVSILIQHEGQVIPDFKNITIYGVAKQLSSDEYIIGRQKIQERRPNADYQEGVKHIYKIIPSRIKILDFTAKPEEQVTIINV